MRAASPEPELTARMIAVASVRGPVVVTRRGRSQLCTLIYWPGVGGGWPSKGGRQGAGAKPTVQDRAGRMFSVPPWCVTAPPTQEDQP